MVVLGKKGHIWATVVVFGHKWFYSGKNGCFREKVVLFGHQWLYSGKVVVMGQSCVLGKKVLVFG